MAEQQVFLTQLLLGSGLFEPIDYYIKWVDSQENEPLEEDDEDDMGHRSIYGHPDDGDSSGEEEDLQD